MASQTCAQLQARRRLEACQLGLHHKDCLVKARPLTLCRAGHGDLSFPLGLDPDSGMKQVPSYKVVLISGGGGGDTVM